MICIPWTEGCKKKSCDVSYMETIMLQRALFIFFLFSFWNRPLPALAKYERPAGMGFCADMIQALRNLTFSRV